MAGLGKGLGALLKQNHQMEHHDEPPVKAQSNVNPAPVLDPENPTSASQTSKFGLTELGIEQLERGGCQPRQYIDPQLLQELAVSIKENGLIQPIVVREIAPSRYEIIAGERRWQAARIAGLKKVPCLVKDYSDKEALTIALIENIQREELNAIETAEALQRLSTELNLTHEEIAERVGKSRSQISNLLRLNELGEKVKDFVKNGELEMGHARALLGVSGEAQEKAALIVIQKGLTVRETEKLVKNIVNPVAPKPPLDRTETDRLQELLTTKLNGMSVKCIPSGKDKGKLILSYKSNEELEKLKSLFLD